MPEQDNESLEQVSQEPLDEQVDSPEGEYEELNAEESEEQTPLEGEQDYVEEEEAGEAEQAPEDVIDPRIQQMEAQMAQQTQQFNQQLQAMQAELQRQAGLRAQPVQPSPPPSLNVDDMTQQQIVDYSIGQANTQSQQYANQVVRNAMGQVGRVMKTVNQMLEFAFESHPDKDLVNAALASMQGNQGPLDFSQALEAQRGKVNAKVATDATKQLKKQTQEQRKRSQRAKGQTRRPRASGTQKQAKMSQAEALRVSGQELGR